MKAGPFKRLNFDKFQNYCSNIVQIFVKYPAYNDIEPERERYHRGPNRLTKKEGMK